MALFKCKMCGGTLEINHQESVATCEYCGMQQTLPKLDDDRRANLYDRANHFRRNNEFDKAMGIYEQILNEDGTDAEAYWSLVLCRYGIEYVEDPSSHKRIPTVNRAQFTSIYEDNNYKSALQYADGSQRQLYEEEAKAINEIQKGILAISEKEEPFDVFICYKESDNSGRRTPDSVLAQDLYYQLKQEGFKVFFSRITLEDKIGSAYEPYIFAALNSAKVMVVLGTKPEHFNAVWVKNEWSRYLSLIKSGEKKTLIPAYRDMDPYDLPEEFSHLQAQDMSKLGFMQDLIRGIKKMMEAEQAKETVVKETVISGGKASVTSFLKRAFIFLEDGEWDNADEYCERVLDIDPENGEAYLGKLMAELHVNRKEQLKDVDEPFDDKNNYQRAVRFAEVELREYLTKLIEDIKTRKENAFFEGNYKYACHVMSHASNAMSCRKAAELFDKIRGYKDSDMLAENMRKDAILFEGKAAMGSNDIPTYEMVIEQLKAISGWKNVDELLEECRLKIEELKAKEEKERLEEQHRREVLRKVAEERAKKVKNVAKIIVAFIAVVIAALLFVKVVVPNGKYSDAITLMEKGKYEDAIAAFGELNGFRDSDNKIEECENAILEEKYKKALKMMEEKQYSSASSMLEILGDYKDSRIKKEECKTAILDNQYKEAMELLETAKYVEAYEGFIALAGYKDSVEKATSMYDIYNTEKKIEELRGVRVGDYITYGRYEQDNNETNGKEDIEWLVLEKKEDQILVISKYALDSQAYHNIANTNVTWETCSLRQWLNTNFINKAFSLNERARIPKMLITADKNPEYDTMTGNPTKDQMFLLSIAEVYKYFPLNEERNCVATEYAKAKGAYINYAKNCYWWLRTQGKMENYASYVTSTYTEEGNNIDEGGYEVSLGVKRDDFSDFIDLYYLGGGGVRPAMWIDLSHEVKGEALFDNYYNTAISFMNAQRYNEAYEIFASLGEFKDSKTKAKDIIENYLIENLSQIKEGENILFGHYEQDNNIENGEEKIEWLVLDVEEGRALVVSKYALDVGMYSTGKEVSWATSKSREWLNSIFFDNAFSIKEKNKILTLTIPKDDSYYGNEMYGEITQDKMFLLSFTEVCNYFIIPESTKCIATVYAVEKSKEMIEEWYHIPDGNRECGWWIRSTEDGKQACYVEDYRGEIEGTNSLFYRPAMWIDLTP